MKFRHMSAAVGLAALVMLGAASLSHYGSGQVLAHAGHAAQPSYVPPTVPAMHLGQTVGETPTTSARPLR